MTELYADAPEPFSAEEVIRIVSEYLDPDDIVFLTKEVANKGMSTEDVIGYVYGRLLSLGHDDPDLLLTDLGILE